MNEAASVDRPRGQSSRVRRPRRLHRWRWAFLLAVAAILFVPASSYAQASPWENAVNVLMTSFTGPIARGLSLVSIVVGGVTFAFGEGGSKRLLAGIIFGVGMAIGAVNFMAWLFPYHAGTDAYDLEPL
ncbi:MAG TPA: TrbC/VirB2 family protein [Vicinamibacterales bacterium]|jgi:type IV secretory pathway VirB2 component (pilin)|nr:TrbC/VirB2 family protein [Vicinamibacterales bacterium]